MQKEYAIRRAGEMEPYPPLPVLNPLVSFELSAMPNLNDVLYMSPMGRKYAVATSRNLGYKAGLAAARALEIKVSTHRVKGAKSLREFAIEMADVPLTEYKIFTILNVWCEQGKKDPSKGNRKRDVYNPVVKSFVDGLTDAGLWVDDNTEYHTDLWVRYRGLGEKGRFELSFYSYRVETD